MCKNFASYHFFSSFLVGKQLQLSSIKAFGKDGELALQNALSATFANAQHVRCFLYFKDNVERKLQELNFPSLIRAEITKDVMGNPLQLQYGQWCPIVSASLVLSQGAHAGKITNASVIYANSSSPPPLIRAPEVSMDACSTPPLSQTSYMQCSTHL